MFMGLRVIHPLFKSIGHQAIGFCSLALSHTVTVSQIMPFQHSCHLLQCNKTVVKCIHEHQQNLLCLLAQENSVINYDVFKQLTMIISCGVVTDDLFCLFCYRFDTSFHKNVSCILGGFLSYSLVKNREEIYIIVNTNCYLNKFC